MIDAGMNVARLNLSHGNYEDHGEVINRVRSLSKEMNKPVSILLDLQGPKIRTGKLQDGKPVMLKRNGTISITTKKEKIPWSCLHMTQSPPWSLCAKKL